MTSRRKPKVAFPVCKVSVNTGQSRITFVLTTPRNQVRITAFLLERVPTLMTGKLHSYIAILLSALYLAEPIVVGTTHRHCDLRCASAICAHEVPGESPAHGACAGVCEHQDDVHACSAFGDAEPKSAENSPPPRAPGHDADNCAICRHLAQGPLDEAPVRLAAIGELVASLPPLRSALYVATVRLAHRSRGPPA
jgi:hypothetical protein